MCLFVPLLTYSASNIVVTLKSGLGVTWGHWKLYHSIRKLGYGVLAVAVRSTMAVFIAVSTQYTRLLTNKSDLWDTSWERVSWKRSRWPGWSKAKELEVDEGKRLWTGYHSLVGKKINDILKICQDRNEHIGLQYIWYYIHLLYWSPTSESDTALTLDWIRTWQTDRQTPHDGKGRVYA